MPTTACWCCDRNGNGAIDSGRELFGDETLLADGKKAAHGFAALAELDVGVGQPCHRWRRRWRV